MTGQPRPQGGAPAVPRFLAPLRRVAFPVALVLAAPASGQDPAPAGMPDEAYTVWLCPMHRDLQAHDESNCPICGMAMVQRTLVTRYVCLGEEDGVVSESPGVCPDTGEALVPTTREVFWTCPGESREHTEPGTCSDGALRAMGTKVSAHGDHNARHGGVLFMAPDGEHHLEGALADGRFRLYFYDAFTQPVAPESFAARVHRSDDAGDPLGGDLELSRTEEAWEARLDGIEAPEGERSAFTAFVSFPGRDAPDRFDFIFLSEAERAALEAANASPVARSLPSALPELVIPDEAAEILAEIRERDRRVQALIAAGRWADLFIPALEAKDLALAYSERGGDRPWVALKRIVRGAWLLDLYGDLGDRIRVGEAYEVFAEGIEGLPGGAE